jgi:hypothetical protein
MTEPMPASLRFLIEGTPPYLKGYTIYTDALQLMVDQRRALVADDWEELSDLANSGIGKARGTFSEMNRTVGVLESMVRAVNNELADLLAEHARNPDGREEYFARMKEEMAADPDVNPDFIEGVEAFSRGELDGNPLYEFLRGDGPEVEDSDKVNDAIDATAALAVRSLMELTFASFQSHYSTLTNLDFQPDAEVFRQAVEERVEAFKDELDARQQALHAAVAGGSAPGPAAEDLMRAMEDSVPPFGRVQATLREYALFLKAEGKGSASEEVGQVSAMAWDLTRSAFAAYGAAYYLALHCEAARPDKQVEALLENVDRIAYDKDVPEGKKTEISKVDELADGDHVRVGGFVSSIETGKDDDGKLITQVTLHDPSSDTSVVAAGIFAHLIHNGLAQDAYCVLSGDWASQSGLNHGDPAIQIEKLAIKELAAGSWKIGFQDLAGRFVERWPANLNMRFGLSPHESGEDEGDSKVMGAGELIYGPFIG